MNATLLETFFKGLLDQGFTSVLFVVAIWYLQKQLDKLDAKITECENDRQKLWERISSKKL